MEEKTVILRSYPQIWNYRKMIYSIEDIKLLVPVAMEDAAFFGLGLVLVALISKMLPIFTLIPFVIRWGVLPFLVMKFLTKIKFDGKKPHKFAFGMVRYAIEPKSYSRFKPTDPIERYSRLKFNYVVMRQPEVVNAVEAELQNLKHERKKRGGMKRNVSKDV